MKVMRTSWLLILLGLIKSTSQSSNTTCDLSKEFDCGDGICLPKAWQCDNVKDCHNGADEIDCEPNECKEEELLCQNGGCTKSKYKCDRVFDCSDRSDEKYCEYNSRRPNVPAPFNFGDPRLYDDGLDKNGCLPGFGYCYLQKTCIPNQSFCDGKLDCHVDNEDERNCTKNKPFETISYISHLVKGMPFFMGNYVNPCEGKFVCKTSETYKDKKCIQMSELCNGKKECPLGDDESEKCSECSTKHCQHRCKNTLTGAKCECNKGYRLNSDGFTCVDIDECTLPERACHHFCENQIGSFRCSCAKGYHLKADGKSCESLNPSKGSLLLGLSNEIEERPLEDFSGTNFTSIVHKLNGEITAFDYFHRDRKIFMVACEKNIICHDGKLVEKEDGKPSKVLRENMPFSNILAVDYIGGNIFLSEILNFQPLIRRVENDTPPIPRISVCTMDGKFCRVILKTRMPFSYTAFAIHPMCGLVFYTEYTNATTRIMMTAMDGSQEQVLIEADPSAILGPLTIDYSNHDLYFGDQTHSSIKRVNIDTKKTTTITSKISFSVTDSMAYHNGFLYSTEHSTYLQVMDVNRKNSRAHLVAPINSFAGVVTPQMAINDSSYQLEPSHNPCREMDCPWICVIVPVFTAKCLCPDGYTPSMLGTTCIPNSLEAEKPGNLSYIGLEAMREYCKDGMGCLNGGSCRKEVSNKIVCDCLEPFDGLYCERRKSLLSDGTVLIIILVIILLLLSIAIGCGFYYRRSKQDGVFDSVSIVSKSPRAVYYENDAVSLG